MENIIKLDGTFIGTVKAYNEKTRELEVFIPKLMPAISEVGEMQTSPTNYSAAKINNLKFNSTVNFSPTFTVKARDMDAKLPDIGSKVRIFFLDENLELGFWYKFNPNGDYKIIEKEKYDDLYYLTINNSTTLVRSYDNVKINLPEGLDSIVLKDEANKTINVNLTSAEDTLREDINILSEIIGSPSEEFDVIDGGEVKKVKKDSSGLYAKIESLDKTINSENLDIPTKLTLPEVQTFFENWVSNKIENNYETNHKYCCYTNGASFKSLLESFDAEAIKKIITGVSENLFMSLNYSQIAASSETEIATKDGLFRTRIDTNAENPQVVVELSQNYIYFEIIIFK